MKIRKISAILVALILTVALCTTVAFADTVPGPHTHGSESGAEVSEEVDVSSNGDPTVSTQFFMYIPAGMSGNGGDIPKMGDTGFDPNILLMGTILVGIAYLGTSRYAYGRP